MQGKALTRRALLRNGAIASALGVGSIVFPAGFGARAATSSLRWDRTLVMVKLNGGNDGLNTLIPYTEPLYLQYRPNIAVLPAQAVQLDGRFALNAALSSLLPAWNKGAGDMAIALGVGYPGPNGSHFKSSDIWDTAVPSDNTPNEGWIARMFDLTPPPSTFAADAAMVCNTNVGPLAGNNIRAVVTSTNRTLVASAMGNVSAEAARDPTYGWMVNEQDIVNHAAAPFDGIARLPLNTTFPNTAIGQQMAQAARVIISNIGAAAITLYQGTYDSHHGQVGMQTPLLKDLGDAVAAFRTELMGRGLWDKVLLMTHSEFGRSAFENSAAGTDHGQANVQFIMGGSVKGGYLADQYKLDTITPQPGFRSLQYQLDFRQILATVMQSWWNAPSTVSDSVLGKSFAPLSIIKSS